MKDAAGEAVTGDYSYTKPDGSTGTITFAADGTAKVTGVTDGKDFTIEGLPYGTTYTVTEDDLDSNWTTTNKRQRGVVIRTNSYTSTAADGYYTWPAPVTYYLPLSTASAPSSATISDLPAVPTGSAVKLKMVASVHASPNPASDADVSDQMGSLYTAKVNASGGIDLSAAAGSVYGLATNSIYGPLIGQRYLYVEYAYPVIGDDEGERGAVATGTLTTDESVAYTNTYKTHDLTISKTASGSVPTGSTFNFSVGLVDGAGDPLSGTYAYVKKSAGTQTGVGTITLDVNGKATISGVASGDTVTIQKVPSGTVWSVDEETWTLAGKWSTSWKSSGETDSPTHDGTASSGTLSADTTVSYTNETPAKANLTIAKTVKGNDAPEGTSFSFDITVVDKDGNPISGDYSYVGTDGKAGTLTFTAGKAIVAGVVGDQEFTIEGLPYNSTYTVTENDPGTGWSTTNQRDRSIVLRDNAYTATAVGGYYTWPTAVTAYLPGGGTSNVSDIPAIPSGSTAVIKKAAGIQVSPNPASDTDAPANIASQLYTPTINADGTFGLAAGQMWSLANNAAYAPKLGQWYLYLDYNYASVSGREATGTVTTDESVTFTNTYQSTTWTPAVTKTLVEDSDTVTTVPDFTFSIAADAASPAGTPMPDKTTATAKGLTTATFGSITYNEAGTYVYDITEDSSHPANGWTYDGDTLKATVTVSADATTGALSTKVTYEKGTAEKGFSTVTAVAFANKFEMGTVDLAVATKWVDGSNAEGTRPDDATYRSSLHLFLPDGTELVATPTVTDNQDNTFIVSYFGLPKYASDGTAIAYYVTQDTATSYKAPAYSGEGHAPDGGTITNTLADPATVDVSGTKVWDDFSNVAKARPASVTLTLANDGTAAATGYEPVWTNTTGNTWTWTYTGLPKFDEAGKQLMWTVTEAQVSGYDAPSYGMGKTSAGNGDAITNRLTDRHDTVTFSATIVWDDFSDVDGVRPTADQIKASLTLTANGATSSAVPTVVDNGDNTFTVTYTRLPTYNADGSTISYALAQSKVADYDAPTFSGGGANVPDGGTIVDSLSNRHDDATLSFTTVWYDDSDALGKRPAVADYPSMIGLYMPAGIQLAAAGDGVTTQAASGTLVSATPKVQDNGNGTWTTTYANLPMYASDGTTIAYYVTQQTASGYEAPGYSNGTNALDRGTVTNTIITVENPTTGGDGTDLTVVPAAGTGTPQTGDPNVSSAMVGTAIVGIASVLIALLWRRRDERL